MKRRSAAQHSRKSRRRLPRTRLPPCQTGSVLLFPYPLPLSLLTLKLALQMLMYPICYTACILPVSISRLSVMNKTPVPLGFIMFSGILFASSGTVNVILWLATRQAYIARRARRVS